MHKIRRIKKITFFCFFISALLCRLYATETPTKPVVFFLTPYIGVAREQIQEHVFCDVGETELYQLSRLDWDIDIGAKVGVQLDAFFLPVRVGLFSVAACAETAFPSTVGSMHDYDWQEMDGILTDYSTHTNSLTEYARLSASVSWLIPKTSLFKESLSPTDPLGASFSIGAEYVYYSFASKDGYSQHASYDSPDVYTYWEEGMPKSYYYDSVVDYALSSLQVWTGLSYRARFTPLFSANVTVRFYPYIQATGDDHHYGKGYYLDKMSGYGGWTGTIEGMFNLNTYNALCVSFEGEYYPVVTGNTYFSSSGTGTYYLIGLHKGYTTYGGSSRWNVGIKVAFRRMF